MSKKSFVRWRHKMAHIKHGSNVLLNIKLFERLLLLLLLSLLLLLLLLLYRILNIYNIENTRILKYLK